MMRIRIEIRTCHQWITVFQSLQLDALLKFVLLSTGEWLKRRWGRRWAGVHRCWGLIRTGDHTPWWGQPGLRMSAAKLSVMPRRCQYARRPPTLRAPGTPDGALGAGYAIRLAHGCIQFVVSSGTNDVRENFDAHRRGLLQWDCK